MSAFPSGCRPASRWLATLPFALFVFASFPAQAQKTASAPEVAEKRADLAELRRRIENLRKELAATEGNRADAADRLRQSEREISRLQRELHQLGNQRGRVEARIDELEAQSRALGSTITQQQLHLEQLIRQHYLSGNPDSLQLLLNGDNPNQTARDLYYVTQIANARATMVEDLRSTLAQKQALAEDSRARAEELLALEAEQKKRHQELEQQRKARQAVHAEISEKVKAQRRQIGSLQESEKRMSQLVDRLSRILAQQAAAARRAEAERQRQARAQTGKPSATGPQAPGGSSRPSPQELENRYEPAPNDGSFARLRGKLRLPVVGTITGRFGRPREGGSTWRGVFIQAANGNPVKAIANGRVVFSEWMRGFGNLMIVDHGDAYLSIYGNNESLLKEVGQSVTGGERIATVGNTGGNPESGLYFELRHKSQPIDPMSWASLK